MKQEGSFYHWLSNGMDLPGETAPWQTITEIMEDRRILIENHLGVKQYSSTQIGVKVKFGMITICGCSLEISLMTREQLVISGKIESITLQRRKHD